MLCTWRCLSAVLCLSHVRVLCVCTATTQVAAFGKTTLGLTYSLVLGEAVLSPAIPSVAARAGGIFFPLAKVRVCVCAAVAAGVMIWLCDLVQVLQMGRKTHGSMHGFTFWQASYSSHDPSCPSPWHQPIYAVLVVVSLVAVAVAVVGPVPGLRLRPRQGHSQEDGRIRDEDLLPDHNRVQVCVTEKTFCCCYYQCYPSVSQEFDSNV